MKYVPNALTITRIVVTPVLLLLLYYSSSLAGNAWAFGLFVIASISDHYDGKLARRYSVESTFGKYLDPLADKILVLGTFIVLMFVLPDVVPWWAVAIIALRDVSVTCLRSWVKKKHRCTLHTTRLAKAKTTVQLVYLIVTLGLLTVSRLSGDLGRQAAEILASNAMYGAVVVVALITAATGVVYFVNVNRLLDDDIDG